LRSRARALDDAINAADAPLSLCSALPLQRALSFTLTRFSWSRCRSSQARSVTSCSITPRRRALVRLSSARERSAQRRHCSMVHLACTLRGSVIALTSHHIDNRYICQYASCPVAVARRSTWIVEGTSSRGGREEGAVAAARRESWVEERASPAGVRRASWTTEAPTTQRRTSWVGLAGPTIDHRRGSWVVGL
jgi:hypothetical protein